MAGHQCDEKPIGFIGFAQASKVLGSRASCALGKPLHMQFCGHAVHIACFNTHWETLERRAASSLHFEGRSAIDLQKDEFLCPLCKRGSNVL